MDPISQGATGAVFAQLTGQEATEARHKWLAIAWLGALAGMAPDLDVFIQSASDPLLFLEYHRHFTHALAFIPIGALVVASVLFRLVRNRVSWRETYVVCLIGYATHGLLDACTSYGTQLFWPFSSMRIAWNNVSVIDPLFTLPLLVCVILAGIRKQRLFTYVGIGWALFYLLLGTLQYQRVIAFADASAREEGHSPQRLTAKPGFANLILWKVIYEHEGAYYVNAVRATTDTTWCPGEHIAKLQLERDVPWLDPSSQQAADIERFRWFSDDYLAPYQENFIIDVRYANVPNEIDPLWGIAIDPDAEADMHADFWPNRRVDAAQRNKLAELFQGIGCRAARQVSTDGVQQQSHR